MDKKKKIILLVLVVVVAAAGALFFYMKNKAQGAAATGTIPGSQPPVQGNGYQAIVAGGPSPSISLSDLKAATWQTQKGGVIISGGRWASGELTSLNGTTVKQTNPDWTGQLVRGGTQINWQKANGELDVWVRVS